VSVAMTGTVSILLLTALFTIGVECANILVVAPMPSYSHFSIPFKLATELAHRGHQVTCINPYPQKIGTKIENYTDISVERNIMLADELKRKLFAREKQGLIENLTSLFDFIFSISEHTLTNERVQKLLHSGKQFDVVIMEYFLSDVFVGLGYHFKAPVILISAAPSSAMNNHIFANPAPLSYVPGSGGTLTKRMNFWQRLENLLMNGVFSAIVQFYHLPQQRKLFNKYFTTDTDLDTVLYNTSLMLTNSHVSVSDAVPHVPGVIEIGGFHVTPKKLPVDIQKFLDDAEEGVVLFSMGSNLRSDDLKLEVREGILKAFSKIEQKVLWKFESELSNLPRNVKIMHWLPQQDILGHPNVRAFISHGGFLSTVEAVYYGVPIIGIPIFGDQKHNIASAVESGYAVTIPLDNLSEESLSWALNEVLTNNTYKENIQLRSKLMHDQPLKPIDSAVYWVEHVIRYKGAPHLRSAGLDLKWYEREMIDVFLFIIVVIATIYICINKLWQAVCFKKRKSPKKIKKK
jgi:UDP:flavonoid glycosyltransferase YjiC (YdhE family)